MRVEGESAVPFCPDHPYCTLSPMHRLLKRRAEARSAGGGKMLTVTRHEMMSFDAQHMVQPGKTCCCCV